MRGVLSANVRLWHLLVLTVLFALVTGGTLVVGAVPAAFWPNGNVRLASAQNSNTISIEGSNNPAVRVLRTSITVPSGKHADIQTIFTTDLHPNTFQQTYAYCFGEFRLDGSASNFVPDESYQLLGGETAKQPNAVSVAMSGIRKGIGPGTHNVDVYIESAYGGCTLFSRALTVLAVLY
jgi:hypothetical protein